MDDLSPELKAPVEWGEVEEPRTPQRLFALKDRDTFMVNDSYGDVHGLSDGLFHDDTRILSVFRLLLGQRPPTLLAGALSQDNVVFTSNSLNKALPAPGEVMGTPGVLHIERKRLLWDDRLYERIRIVNYGYDEASLPLAFEFDADFHDMFEVRGARRPRQGKRRAPEVFEHSVRFRYEGLDEVERASAVAFSDKPGYLGGNRAEFHYVLKEGESCALYVEIGATDTGRPSRERFRTAMARARLSARAKRRHGARLHSTGRLFNAWIEKSVADLALLATPMDTGVYPYAGIPWFSTAFGRDGIITAWQTLWFEPSLARGVLRYLAANQATEVSAFRDSEPGKIMHETRRGEMAALGEVPFGRYYGGVDTTPLFVALAGAYYERTADQALIDSLWPALEKAADWVVRRSGSNADGLLDYARGAESGLSNQGWKDSGDSVFHADGRFPKGPIALVEVQGYAWAAYRTMANFAALRGDRKASGEWLARAERLQETVERLFWMPKEKFYGIAMDGDGELCAVRASNPGHLLFVGMIDKARAAHVAEGLMAPQFFSGWGVRTLATGQPRYNPMSYHNGSVWPHDTALSAMGMSRYGERDGPVRLLAGLFETATQMDMRLPELFCGFARGPGEPPVPYPVACIPQAWAAGSMFMMLQACLGLTIDATAREIVIRNPRLPIGIDSFIVDRLRVADEHLTLRFERKGLDVAVTTKDAVKTSVIVTR
jgi:glycogen debranching enzyme